MRSSRQVWLPILLVCLAAVAASGQSFRVQCPASTITHPPVAITAASESGTTVTITSTLQPAAGTTVTISGVTPAGYNGSFTVTGSNSTSFTYENSTSGLGAGTGGFAVGNSEPPYQGPTYTGTSGYPSTPVHLNGAIKCQQIAGGDGFATMGDGTQTYMFSFGPLSGLRDMANGQPGTQFPDVFNTVYTGPRLQPGDPATADGITSGGPNSPTSFPFNGAVGLVPHVVNTVNIYEASESGTAVTIVTNAPLGVNVGDQVKIVNLGAGYDGTFTVTATNVANPYFSSDHAFSYTAAVSGLAQAIAPFEAGFAPVAATLPTVDGHVDPRPIMDIGTMNGNIPAPLMAIDEDDEFFLTLTNVGMIMRPDLFEQHTVHFHGYPNASSFYDGVPDASVAINIGGSFTYYYLAPDAGTYFWHCHITPPEHLQMGMVGQIYVRPRQNRVAVGNSLYAALQQQQLDPRTACNPGADILCTNPPPPANTVQQQVDLRVIDPITSTADLPYKYAYNDGNGSTMYDVEYPLQIHGFDPSFHFVGMTFNPEGFADMKDKYFLLNGRSYPDTVTPGPLATMTTDGSLHYSQPLPSIINIPEGGRALLRISDLDVAEHQTLASLGIPMTVIALNAKMLRDQAGNDIFYKTNSITLGGGESLDVILDVSDTSTYHHGQTFYLYTPNLDHLSNDAENFGGLMTEVHICSTVTGSTFGNTCN